VVVVEISANMVYLNAIVRTVVVVAVSVIMVVKNAVVRSVVVAVSANMVD
jgi:hypothetical protein